MESSAVGTDLQSTDRPFHAKTFSWTSTLVLIDRARAVMFAIAAEQPVLVALAVLFAGWVVRVVRQGYAVRKTFHGQVCCVIDMVDL